MDLDIQIRRWWYGCLVLRYWQGEGCSEYTKIKSFFREFLDDSGMYYILPGHRPSK